MKRSIRTLGLAVAALACGVACGGQNDVADDQSAVTLSSHIQRVFVIAMENHSATDIYGNTTDAPYINTLLSKYAYAGPTAYTDDLAASVPSEPHYIEMESGTNVLPDHTFSTDGSPSSSNSSTSHLHLTHLLSNAGVPWRAYEEGLNTTTGVCPIANDYDAANQSAYAVRHDPFVYFTDVTGTPLSKTNASCASHFKPFSAFQADVAANAVANYNFITPNLCHDMHVQGCGSQTSAQKMKAGDTWLKGVFAYLIPYVEAHSGVIFVVWDEGSGNSHLPMLAIGPNLKSAGYESKVSYIHASLTKSLQEIFEVSPSQGVPWLGKASQSSTHDFSDFFSAGSFP